MDGGLVVTCVEYSMALEYANVEIERSTNVTRWICGERIAFLVFILNIALVSFLGPDLQYSCVLNGSNFVTE